MGQVTIYLDKETEQKLNAIVGNAPVSKSKWISDLIRTRIVSSWPESIIKMAGTWKNFPSAEDIRKTIGEDIPREPL